MTNSMKILAGLDFSTLIAESTASTATGSELLNKYKSYCMMKETSCGLVNGFIREAGNCRYDNGVAKVLETVADYISLNKTSWALATACENINSNAASYNYLNRNAAKQVESLLEMDEENVVTYIKSGALKNVMFCEAFRNIAKQVFKDNPMVEATAEFTVSHPVSFTENVGDGFCFEVLGTLYKMDSDKNVQECSWKEVSNTFRTISSLLESNLAQVSNGDIEISVGRFTYTVTEAGKCKKCKKNADGTCTESELTVDQLREDNNLIVKMADPRQRTRVAGILEALALMVENYDLVANLDVVSVYETKNDKFVVIEAGDNLYSTSIFSTRNPKWTVNEDIMKSIDFIKSKTNVSLNERYKEKIQEHVAKAAETEKENIQAELQKTTLESYKERIQALVEKFKDDPTKLAVLAKIAENMEDNQE